MSQYEPSFSGVIADTYQESTPAWPPLPEGLNGANVITIVFDDMGEILPGGRVLVRGYLPDSSVPIDLGFVALDSDGENFSTLDGLKALNDAEGHAAGDSAILALARAIGASIRDADVACRAARSTGAAQRHRRVGRRAASRNRKRAIAADAANRLRDNP